MTRFRLPGRVKAIAGILRDGGFQCYLVGGAVRNLVMGSAPKDYDLATDALPEEVRKLFHRVIPTGIEHGTVTVLFKGEQFEVTTFRSETAYSDGRHPDAVRFEQEIHADLSRRDFTMNGMAVDVHSGELYDPFDGRGDIRRGLVRAIGEPQERLREDGLRIMRALRFAAQLGFRIEEETFTALQGEVEALRPVAEERIREELVRMLEAAVPSEGLRPMYDCGAMRLVLPELADCPGTPQEGGTVADLLEHLLLTCDAVVPARSELRLAALLHDIGKPDTMEEGPEGVISFHGHAERSAELSEGILTRLRFPTRTIRYVRRLISAHMIHYQQEWSDAAVRRFVHRVGPDAVWDLIALQRADLQGKRQESRSRKRRPGLEELEDRVREILDAESALSLRDLAVNGRDLQAEASIPAGPALGQVLDFLLETVLDDPGQNNRERLLEIARNFYEERLKPGSGER